MGKKSVIETGVDKLVKLISETKKISVKDAAKELGVSVSSIEDWADFLEEEGIITIQAKFATVYLVEKQIGKKELVEKVKAVRNEKDAFVLRVESSMNSLERDGEEIKLIDSEFKQIKDILEKRFSQLSKKLGMLEDFRKSHREIGSKCNELESEYDKKLNEIDKRMGKEDKKYHAALAGVDAALSNIRAEKETVVRLKSAETELQSKVNEINRLIENVHTEIDHENKQLDIDEERLDVFERTAKSIRKEIESTSKDLEGLSKQFKSSRKELEGMEHSFMKDIESLKKGDVENIGPFKESKEILLKFKKFFSQANEVEGLIHNAENEEIELHDHFQKLSKKVRAFSAVTSVPEIKDEMGDLHDELVEIESKKRMLANQLKKLRNFVRTVI